MLRPWVILQTDFNGCTRCGLYLYRWEVSCFSVSSVGRDSEQEVLGGLTDDWTRWPRLKVLGVVRGRS